MQATGLMQSLLGLLLVIGSIFALAWMLRRLQRLRPQRAGALRLHAGLSVGTRERVLWIEAGGRHLLLGVAPGSVRTLHVFEQAPTMPEAPAEAAGVQAPSFGDLLKKALGKPAK